MSSKRQRQPSDSDSDSYNDQDRKHSVATNSATVTATDLACPTASNKRHRSTHAPSGSSDPSSSPVQPWDAFLQDPNSRFSADFVGELLQQQARRTRSTEVSVSVSVSEGRMASVFVPPRAGARVRVGAVDQDERTLFRGGGGGGGYRLCLAPPGDDNLSKSLSREATRTAQQIKSSSAPSPPADIAPAPSDPLKIQADTTASTATATATATDTDSEIAQQHRDGDATCACPTCTERIFGDILADIGPDPTAWPRGSAVDVTEQVEYGLHAQPLVWGHDDAMDLSTGSVGGDEIVALTDMTHEQIEALLAGMDDVRTDSKQSAYDGMDVFSDCDRAGEGDHKPFVQALPPLEAVTQPLQTTATATATTPASVDVTIYRGGYAHGLLRTASLPKDSVLRALREIGTTTTATTTTDPEIGATWDHRTDVSRVVVTELESESESESGTARQSAVYRLNNAEDSMRLWDRLQGLRAGDQSTATAPPPPPSPVMGRAGSGGQSTDVNVLVPGGESV